MSDNPGGSPGGPPGPMRLTLRQARLIVAIMYAVVLVLIVVRPLLPLPKPMGPQPDLLLWVLAGTAAISYIVSLALETAMLGGARLRRSPTGAEATASGVAIMVAAYGVAIGIYGVVLGFLAMDAWCWYFYAAAVIHGLHQQLRWDKYEEAVSRATSS